eukprot:TRINITY_DN1455_c0_g1_i1.p1 TRINITY_DN1455_c0_g1~~TRINITY_DN1455_c0_g1_i1.p1  ORF type:complete len:597 (+),score=142.55 TRINITY_DN1455_c0_g1_i1:69-1793(+)
MAAGGRAERDRSRTGRLGAAVLLYCCTMQAAAVNLQDGKELRRGPKPSLPAGQEHHVSVPCPTHGAINISGAVMGQINGFYVHSEGKQVWGHPTYWMPSGFQFIYYCGLDGTWDIAGSGDFFNERAMNECWYYAWANAHPSAPGVDWFVYDGVSQDVQQAGVSSSCIADARCDVADGSGPSSRYPCTCGGSNVSCVSSQRCNAAAAECSDCGDTMQVQGFDMASSAAATRAQLQPIVGPFDGLWQRDQSKLAGGRPTYWMGPFYFFWCSTLQLWGISRTAWRPYDQQGVGDPTALNCIAVVYSRSREAYRASPLGITQWLFYHTDASQYLSLEHDNWHSVFTCPAPPQSPTSSPVHGVISLAAGGLPVAPFPVSSDSLAPGTAELIYDADHTAPGAWLSGATLYRIGDGQLLPAGAAVDIACLSAVCDVYVFHWHQPPQSSMWNGDLPFVLRQSGWSPGSCAPRLRIVSSGCHFPMVAHRRQLREGDTVSFAVGNSTPALYVVPAAVPGVICADNDRQQGQAECEQVPEDAVSACKWDGSACIDTWCPPRTRDGAGGDGVPHGCPSPADGVALR